MNTAQLKLKLAFFFFFLNLLLLFIPTSAEAIVDCCPTGSGWCADETYCRNNLLNCCYPSCPYQVWTDTGMSECQGEIGSSSPYCCRSPSCSGTSCGTIYYWDWCYVDKCQKKASESQAFDCDYQYKYKYTSCGAVDSCTAAHAYLNAGQCDSSGCTVGGIYKTCCTDANGDGISDGTVNGNCNGGLFSGTCPSGSITVQCGFGGKPACGTAACAVAGPTPTPGGPPPPPEPDRCPGSCCRGSQVCNNPISSDGRWDSECGSWGGKYDIDCRQRTGDCGARCCESCDGGGGGRPDIELWLNVEVYDGTCERPNRCPKATSSWVYDNCPGDADYPNGVVHLYGAEPGDYIGIFLNVYNRGSLDINRDINTDARFGQNLSGTASLASPRWDAYFLNRCDEPDMSSCQISMPFDGRDCDRPPCRGGHCPCCLDYDRTHGGSLNFSTCKGQQCIKAKAKWENYLGTRDIARFQYYNTRYGTLRIADSPSLTAFSVKGYASTSMHGNTDHEHTDTVVVHLGASSLTPTPTPTPFRGSVCTF